MKLLAPLSSVLLVSTVGLSHAGARPVAGDDEVDFARDIRPILEARCFECHGPDKQKSGLRLDTRAGLFESEDPDFVPIVPGDPDASTAFELISLDADDVDRMPSEGDPLSEEQIEKIRRWIEQGAPYPEEGAAAPPAPIRDLEWRMPDPATAPQGPVDFNQDVQPILSEHCFACHGPDAEQRKVGLRLDTEEGLFDERNGRAMVVAGDVAQSLLAHRVLAVEGDQAMPPPDAEHQLDDAERWVLLKWIEQGAEWKQHWSFVPPERPAMPSLEHADWLRNELDHFVLARMEAAGLEPSPEADRWTLLRRVTLDLTGMPVERSRIEALVAMDEASFDAAYLAYVDELFASIAHAEHMARYWLDAARYGDTHGLHLDSYREMWPYRDWVVQSFHRNQRYDDFVTWQLAGDLLGGEDGAPTLEQLVASGFNRCHVTTAEGGSIKEEVLIRNVVDRTSTAGVVFMGLGVGCAVCHDHKFDPISQKEFFQLSAFFNNLDGDAMDGNRKDPAPVIRVPTEELTARLDGLAGERVGVEAEIATALTTVQYREPEPESEGAPGPRVTTVWVDDGLPEGAVVGGSSFEWQGGPEAPVHSGERSMLRRGKGMHQHYFKDAGRKLRVGPGDTLFAWVWIDPVDPPREVMLQWNNDGDAGWMHRAYWGENLVGFGKDGTTERRHLGPLPPAGQWTKLEVSAQHVGLRPGMIAHGIAFTQFDGTAYWDEAGIVSATPQAAEDFVWIDDEAPEGAKKQGEAPNWGWVGEQDGHPVASGERSLRRSGGDRLNQDFFTGAKPLALQRDDRLFASVYLDPKDPPRSIQLQFNDGTWEHRVRWGDEAHGPGRAGGADHRAGDLPKAGEWVRLEVGLDEVALKPGARLNGWAFTQVAGTVYWDRAGVKTWSPPDDRALHSFLAWQAVSQGDAQLPKPVQDALAMAADARSAEQQKQLRDHYLRHVWVGSREEFEPLEARLKKLDGEVKAAEAAIPTTLVMKERATPRDAYVLIRGQYDQRGEKVERATPAVLPPLDPALPRDRLGLARWLVDPAHPLTARVYVNRLWQQFFGVGLVKTSEDFGNQGERPSHPQLLDWMAVQFVEDGWDVRRTLRRIVSSATYRQSSRSTPELLSVDRDNRLIARGARFRLDAEMLRDQALELSGLLVRKVGGPGVKPPQPDGLWRAVGYSSSNTARFKADVGPEAVHRRTLYTFLKRTAVAPQMSMIDAPNREECCTRRERTNTPLQALLLMNDPQYVECAIALARRILSEGGEDDRARIAWAFTHVTGRPASAPDLGDLSLVLEAQRAEFVNDPDLAKALVKAAMPPPELDPVELGSWTMVANLLLNLDEVVTKE